MAKLPVTWAGQKQSTNWFDIAREYTEKWHHQMQIRLAVNKSGIFTAELFHPVIDCFMRGLPFAYHTLKGIESIEIRVLGIGGGTWFLEKRIENWCLVRKLKNNAEVTIIVSGEIAWQLLTDSISKEVAEKQIEVIGDKIFALPFLNASSAFKA